MNLTLEFQKEFFREILDHLVNKCNFQLDWLSTYSNDFYRWFNTINLEKENFNVSFGSSKLVIIPKDFNYVLKLPFLYEKDEKSNIINYCDIEAENYIKAKENGFDNFFAESYYLMTYNEIPCYCMKKVVTSRSFDFAADLIDNYILSGMSKRDAYDSVRCLDDEEIVREIFICRYGIVMVDSLYDFMCDNNINDIHDNNVGYDENDNVIIIDYSGYF